MSALKKLFPLSFKYDSSVGRVIVGAIVYVIVAVLAGLLIGLANVLLGWIPVIGAIAALIAKIFGAVIELYVAVGIILSILSFLKVLKD